MEATEFLKDFMRLQEDYMAMKTSGFFNHKKELRLLDPIMLKYGMTYEKAVNSAKNRLTMAEYLRILERRMGND